jgi:hypothetical protein
LLLYKTSSRSSVYELTLSFGSTAWREYPLARVILVNTTTAW